MKDEEDKQGQVFAHTLNKTKIWCDNYETLNKYTVALMISVFNNELGFNR